MAGTGHRTTWRTLGGLLLVGWGIFNLVEGVVDHHVLTIHHVRDDVTDPLWWDLGFLAFGALLVVGGLALRRSDRPVARAATSCWPSASPTPAQADAASSA